MKALKKVVNSKYFYGILWTVIIIAVWELFATIVQFTKRTPENVLPHISGILKSIFTTQTINGSQTALQMVMQNAAATLSRAAIGFAIGIAAGFILALLMNLSGAVEKIAFPYLMLIQMIPVLGLAPIVIGAINQIKKPEYRALLEMRYIDFKSWEQIATEMRYSIDNIFKMHRNALKCVVVPKQYSNLQ